MRLAAAERRANSAAGLAMDDIMSSTSMHNGTIPAASLKLARRAGGESSSASNHWIKEATAAAAHRFSVEI